MAAICIKAADGDAISVATEAFDELPAEVDLSRPAMAMAAMHIRNGNIEAAEVFWRMLELSPTKPDFIEPTAMPQHCLDWQRSCRARHCVKAARCSLGSGTRSQALMKPRWRPWSTLTRLLEVMGQFYDARVASFLPPRAGMELMWSMIENGGLVTPVALHLLAGMGT